MTVPKPLIIAGLFLAGLVGGWFTPVRKTSDVGVGKVAPVPTRGEAEEVAASEKPAGRSDFSYRAAWEEADEASKPELLKRWNKADPEDALRYFALELVNVASRDPKRLWGAYLDYKGPQSDPVGVLTLINTGQGEISDALTSGIPQCLPCLCKPANLAGVLEVCTD